MRRASIETAFTEPGQHTGTPEVLLLRPGSAARRWADRAIVAGRKPMVRQQPLSGEDAGEWRIVTVKGASSEALPEELWEEVFAVLADLGRIQYAQGLTFWHGDCLPEDGSAQARAFRLRFARRAMGLDMAAFYGALGLDDGTAQAVEAGALVLFPSAGNLERLCGRHGIPPEWLAFGVAAEIEL